MRSPRLRLRNVLPSIPFASTSRAASAKPHCHHAPNSPVILGLGLRVKGLGFRVRVSGFGYRMQGIWFRVSGLGVQVLPGGSRTTTSPAISVLAACSWGSGSVVCDLGSRFSVEGFPCRVPC